VPHRLVQASNLHVHLLPGGYIVHHRESGQVHQLNATATLLFELSNGTATADADQDHDREEEGGAAPTLAARHARRTSRARIDPPARPRTADGAAVHVEQLVRRSVYNDR
jgi:hypothetical protein